MQKITSKDNSIIKHIKKLKEKKYRNEYNEFIVEGIKLVAEAIKENAKVKQIVISEGFELDKKIDIEKFNCVLVPEDIFKTITEVETPQGILAVIEKTNKKEIDYNEDILVALDNVQDPGNVGTILRTIDSVGLKQVLVSKGTADIYNSKVIRSTMGAIFRINIIECDDLKQTLYQVKEKGFDITVTSLDAKETIYDIDYYKRIIVMGNEANGVSKEIQDLADEKVIIPMLGNAESLNVSIATGIVLYEYVRQKI